MKKKKIRRGQILMLIGAFMIVGALSLAIYNHIKEQNVGEKSEEVLSELESLINKGKNETHVSEGEDDILEGLDEENAVKNNPEETKESAALASGFTNYMSYYRAKQRQDLC